MSDYIEVQVYYMETWLYVGFNGDGIFLSNKKTYNTKEVYLEGTRFVVLYKDGHIATARHSAAWGLVDTEDMALDWDKISWIASESDFCYE